MSPSTTQNSKYLGVWLTPSLNWKNQMQALVEAVTEKGNALLYFRASPLQCMQIIDRCIKPCITYSFPTGAYTMCDIARLDSLINKINKYIRQAM